MISKLKKFTVQMMTGANVATVIVMLLVGYSDRINPSDHPLMSTVGMAFPILLVINMAFLLFWLIFKWSRAWVPAVGFVIAYVPISIYMPINVVFSPPDDAIKLVSYNVCSYNGNFKYQQGFEKISDYLHEEQPDIVCLQEDNDVLRRNAFSEYEKKGFPYNDTIVLCCDELRYNGLGIHTRYPIIRRERINYPTASNNGSAAWWLQVGKDTLLVVNNHFESCHLNQQDRQQYRQLLKGEMARDSVRAESQLLMVKLAEANAKRSKQIEAVCDFVDQYIGRYPIIVCGDFNDNPISFSRHRMAKSLTDCFKETGRGIGLSYNQKAFSFRIDHVFCSSNITPYQCHVDTKMDASDHYPMVCWLKFDVNP
ncbi:Metal-dependent hydrolase, endonuclease/exonuclease/phosphatase family [Prevotellaceae bacterium HUN156]|nr:Metal-dependent hydrolase, endonuclease/exonuclease/phosphatase family [Prevotellaceae bacterium HUN156]